MQDKNWKEDLRDDVAILSEAAEEKVKRTTGLAGQKYNEVRDSIGQITERAKRSLDGGWQVAKTRSTEFVKQQPFTTALIAFGLGLLLGALTMKHPRFE